MPVWPFARGYWKTYEIIVEADQKTLEEELTYFEQKLRDPIFEGIEDTIAGLAWACAALHNIGYMYAPEAPMVFHPDPSSK